MSGHGSSQTGVGSSSRQPHRHRPAPPKERILIVEDDRETREVIELALQGAGYVVTACIDAIAAQLEIERALPDAFVVDHNLPGATGMSFCRWLHDNPVTADLPAIMYTASGDADTAAEARRAGCADFLVKPVSTHELVSRLGAAIARYRVKST